MSCILRIDGINFRVDDFIKSTDLKPYRIYRKGDKIKVGKKKIQNSNGCSFDLSKTGFKDFEQQRKDVIEYLNKNFLQLSTVYSFGLKNDENPTVDFGIENLMMDFWCQTEYLEPELLKLVGNLNFGIEISLYRPNSVDIDNIELETDKKT